MTAGRGRPRVPIAELIPYMPTKDELGRLDILAWRRFARRAQRNPFMQSHVRERDGASCVWCGGFVPTGTGVLHHTNYLHVCSFGRDAEIVNERGHHRHVPDCASCFADDRTRFNVCAALLRLVHNGCNQQIAEITPPAADRLGASVIGSRPTGHHWRRTGPGESLCMKCGLTARRKERKYERGEEVWTGAPPLCDGRRNRRRKAKPDSLSGADGAPKNDGS